MLDVTPSASVAVISVTPGAAAVTPPLASTLATAGSALANVYGAAPPDADTLPVSPRRRTSENGLRVTVGSGVIVSRPLSNVSGGAPSLNTVSSGSNETVTLVGVSPRKRTLKRVPWPESGVSPAAATRTSRAAASIATDASPRSSTRVPAVSTASGTAADELYRSTTVTARTSKSSRSVSTRTGTTTSSPARTVASSTRRATSAAASWAAAGAATRTERRRARSVRMAVASGVGVR